MYENFKDWSVKKIGHQPLESGDEAEFPIQFQYLFIKEPLRVFHFAPLQNYRTIKQKQRVIWAYVGAVYHKSILG